MDGRPPPVGGSSAGGDALGAWIGGLTIGAGLGYVSPIWAGAAMTVAALLALTVASVLDRRVVEPADRAVDTAADRLERVVVRTALWATAGLGPSRGGGDRSFVGVALPPIRVHAQ